MPSAGRKGVVLMKQHFSYLCVQLLPHSISCGEPPPSFPHWQWRGSPAAESLQLALFCFPFLLREVGKHPTKRWAQQSKPACYTNTEQVTAARCSHTLHGDMCNSHTGDAALDSSIAVWDRHKCRVQGSLHLLMLIQPLGKPSSIFFFLSLSHSPSVWSGNCWHNFCSPDVFSLLCTL